MVFVVWLPGPQSRKAREFFTIDIGFLHRAEQSFELIYQILPKLPGEVVGGVGEEGEDEDRCSEHQLLPSDRERTEAERPQQGNSRYYSGHCEILQLQHLQ